MNQLLDHSIAWSNNFYFPRYSSYNFTPYGNGTNNSYLTNPYYSIDQMHWGTPNWNNLPWNNNSNNNMWSPWGWNSSQTNSSNNSDSSSNTTANRKYNRLYSLVNQLKEFKHLKESDRDALVDAMKAKGTTDEKYEKLLEAYNQISKDTVRRFLAEEGYNLGVSKNVKDTFYNRLLSAGFEKDTDLDEKLADFYNNIKTLKDKDAKAEIAEGLIGLIGTSYDILDVISSWNSKYNDGDKNSSRMIQHIANYYNKLEDNNSKETVKNQILVPLVDKLITKANNIKGDLDRSAQIKIKKAINQLQNTLNNTDNKISDDLSTYFDNLYLLTRQGAMTIFRNDAKSYYGEIDSDVFNNNLFDEEITEDLKDEGFSDEEISNTKVNISHRPDSDNNDGTINETDEDELENIDKKPVAEQIEILIKHGIIEKLEKTYQNYTIYQETSMTGDSNGDGVADYHKLFLINKNGNLAELQNLKQDKNNNYVRIDSTKNIKQEKINASKIIEASEEAVNFEIEASNNINNNEPNFDKEDPAWTRGEEIAGLLIGNTMKEDNQDALEKIEAIEADKVFITLAGYEDDDALGHDIIEQIVREGDNTRRDDKIKMIKHILECAVKNLQAQIIDERKKNEDVKDYEKLKNLEEDIPKINDYLSNISENISSTDAAGEIDDILKKYIDEAHNENEDQTWFGQAGEAIGNFFCNLFDMA